MLPFASREDVDFFSHLEMHLRQEHPPLAGRDHMSYRGSYFPVSFGPVTKKNKIVCFDAAIL